MLNDRISELKATRDQASPRRREGLRTRFNAPDRVSHLRRVQAHRRHSGGYRRESSFDETRFHDFLFRIQFLILACTSVDPLSGMPAGRSAPSFIMETWCALRAAQRSRSQRMVEARFLEPISGPVGPWASCDRFLFLCLFLGTAWATRLPGLKFVERLPPLTA